METKSLYPIIVTTNIDETIKFYSEVFDYSVKHNGTTKTGSRLVVLANDKGLEIELMEKNENTPVNLPEGLYGLRINVSDMEKTVEELKQKGATILAGPFDTGAGKNLMMKDNNGIAITLIEHIKK